MSWEPWSRADHLGLAGYVAIDAASYQRVTTPQVRRPHDVVGRDDESLAVRENAAPGQVVLLNGEPGSGRTTLLHALAHADWREPFPDGVIYLDAAKVHPDDLGQWVFETLYVADAAFRPDPARLAELLADARMLMLVDDADAHIPTALPWLSSAMPDSAIVATTGEPHELGQVVTLGGLPVDAAVQLLSVGAADEHTANALREIATALRGHPGDLRIAAILLREGTFAPGALASSLARGAEPRSSLAAALVRSLSAQAKDVLGLLASLDTPVTRQHVAAIIGNAEAEEGLGALLRTGLLTADSTHVRLIPSCAQLVRTVTSTGPWLHRTLDHLVDWVAEHSDDTDRLLADAPLLQRATIEAADRARYGAVATLARNLAPALTGAARWGAASVLLGLAVEAGRSLADTALSQWASDQAKQLDAAGAHLPAQPSPDHAVPGQPGQPERPTAREPSFDPSLIDPIHAYPNVSEPGQPTAQGISSSTSRIDPVDGYPHVPDQQPLHHEAPGQPAPPKGHMPWLSNWPRVLGWKVLALVAIVVIAVAAIWVMVTGNPNQPVASQGPISSASLPRHTETSPPVPSTSEPIVGQPPSPTSSTAAQSPPPSSGTSRTTPPGTAPPAMPPPQAPPPPIEPPPMEPPPTYTLLIYLKSVDGGIDVFIAGAYVGSCNGNPDSGAADCRYSMQSGDAVTLSPVGYVHSWGEGPCRGTDPYGTCVFSATGNVELALYVEVGIYRSGNV